jgi:DNA-directed RNA polymerase specialized sigma24 family protein
MKNTIRNAALAVTPALPLQPILDLDAQVRLAFLGDRNALDAVARELQPELVYEARRHLGDLEVEADDVVQDLFVAILERRVRAPRGRGEALALLLRLTRVFARRRRGPDPTIPRRRE